MAMRVFGYKVLCELLFDIVKTKKSDLHIRFFCFGLCLLVIFIIQYLSEIMLLQNQVFGTFVV